MGVKKEYSADLFVKSMEPAMMPPCLPSPAETLYLSNIDDQHALRMMFNVLLLYDARENVSADPANVIREALSKVLVYYYPLAGRLRTAQNGKLQVHCTGEGAVFVEATTDNTLSVLHDLNDLKLSFQQLLFQFPPCTSLEDIHPLIVQVTRFSCGGFVVGMSFHHSMCDGRGAAQFFKALAEMASGHVKPSVDAIWCRELLKPRDLPRVEFQHMGKVAESRYQHPFPEEDEEFVQDSIVISSQTIDQMKRNLMEECEGLQCTTFDIVTALAWKARTKALQIPHGHTVRLVFAADVRKSLKPPLPEGYYGNCIVPACTVATAEELVNGSLSHAIKMIKETKLSLNDEFLRSHIEIIESHRDVPDMYVPPEDMIVSDWRRLGFDEVDFGWGVAINVSPFRWNGRAHANYILFLRPPTSKDGVKILVCMPRAALKLFELEMQMEMAEIC